MRLSINPDGTSNSLIYKPTGEECLEKGCNMPVFSLTQYRPYDNELFLTYPARQKTFNADTVYWEGDDLMVGFELETYFARISITVTDSYIGFKLLGFEYEIEDYGIKRKTEIDEFTLLQLPVRDRAYFGEWLNVSWDNNIAINLLATGPYTKIDADARKGYHIMQARMQADVKILDVGAALITTSKDKLLSCIDKLEADYNLPRGVQSRQKEEYKYSYYELRNVTTQNIDEHISYAQKGGFRAMVIYWMDFATSMGHFPWKPEYPKGMADLKEITGKIEAAGMIAGFHIHYNKVSVDDPYITPIPDSRLNLRRIFTLSEKVEPQSTVIRVEENPEGCTKEDGRRFLKIGNELISYDDYSILPPYQFTGCKRGELGTHISRVEKGFKFGLLDVDTWPLFVRIDQRTSIQKEIAERISKICAEAGFKFIYFDGAEDVHPPYWYTVSKSQQEVYNSLETKPLFSEGAAKSHFGWHMLTRGNAFDVFPPEFIKEATKKHPVSAAKYIAQDFSSINFGWIDYISPNEKTMGMQPDMYEYVCSRGAAWDCPISLLGRLDQLKLHSRTPDNLEVIRRWEEARIQNFFTETQKEKLKNLEQEHILLINENGNFELLPYTQIPHVANGNKNVRAFVFDRADKIWVVYWHTSGEGSLELPVSTHNLCLFEESGREISLQGNEKNAIIPVGGRRYLRFDLSREEVVDLFSKAKINKH
uniref:hypothetical protein n=1 Tax=uncultured Draconibacterium sp. TaxID=1573823 RepID=UPI0032172C81